MAAHLGGNGSYCYRTTTATCQNPYKAIIPGAYARRMYTGTDGGKPGGGSEGCIGMRQLDGICIGGGGIPTGCIMPGYAVYGGGNGRKGGIGGNGGLKASCLGGVRKLEIEAPGEGILLRCEEEEEGVVGVKPVLVVAVLDERS